MKGSVVRVIVACFLAMIAADVRACEYAAGCDVRISRSLTFEDGACLDEQTLRYHAFSFHAEVGTRLRATVQSGFFSPAVEVIAPNGAVIASDHGGALAEALAEAQSTGTYYVKVRNQSVGAGGPYALEIDCAKETEPPPPDFALSILPGSLTLSRGESGVFIVTSRATGGFSENVQLAVVNVPGGVTASPVEATVSGASGSVSVVVSAGAEPVNGSHQFAVTGTAASGKFKVATAQLVIDAPCIRPTVWSISAPEAVVIGQDALVSATVTGTAPIAFQWYSGFSPSTNFPVRDATASDFRTPSLRETAHYWVNASNACGSHRSQTVTIQVVEAPTKRRSVRH